MKVKRSCQYWLSVALLLLVGGVSQALIVTHEYLYYYIDPGSHDEVRREMEANGPLVKGRHMHALYRPHIDFLNQIYLKQEEDRCNITIKPYQLRGVITLPKLMLYKRYDDRIVEQYEEMYEALNEHELMHESIYQSVLEEIAVKVDTLIEQYQSPLCSEWRSAIVEIFDAGGKKAKALNQAFDCESYGLRHGYPECQHLLNQSMEEAVAEERVEEIIKKPETVERIDRELDKERCLVGEVIEPFKGYFYCIN